MSISQKSVRIVVFITVLIVTAVAFGGFALFAPTAEAQNADRPITKDISDSATVAPDAVFAANAGTLGAIPDSPAGGNVCADFTGAPRNVTFTVAGMSAPLSDVRVSVTGTHTWVGDLDISLIAPNGATALILSQTGSTTATGCGDDSDFGGPYNFFDAAPTSPTWWGAATTASATTALASGSYRTSSTGGVVGGGALTLLTPSFAGLTAGQINGTWTLRVRDGGEGDTGSITGASLTLTTTTTNPQHIVDYDGDGKTDFTVVRNTGGGPTGQITWFVGPAAGGFTAQPWGLATDFFEAGDYDGDHKTDITVWRAGTQSYFYILQSTNNTLRAVPFGVTGDDPSVEGDYTGDGKTDPAVYRSGANAGDRSYWYYLASSGPLNGQIVVTQWGQNGDFPAPGDFNGDLKADFCVQRNGGGGAGVFFEHDGSGGGDVPGVPVVTYFGTPTDVIVPGDYDGDGKTDIATVRGISGQIYWFYDPSSIAGLQVVAAAWGASATDFLAQGDYDGDGRTDLAIWRPSITAGETAFYYNGTTTGVGARQWGQNGDYPVANYNQH